MPTLQWIQLGCPVCVTRFDSMAAVGNEADGASAAGAGSPSAAGVLPSLVHVCCRCGYAGRVDDFADEVFITRAVRDRVWRELATTLAPSVRMPWLVLTACGSEKYEGAAKVAEWRGAGPLTIGDLWISAARSALDEGDHEAERYYARLAARWFTLALELGGVDPGQRAGLTLGLGALWVRIGDVQSGADWFRRVEREIVDPQAQRSLVEAAARQVRIDAGA